VPGRIHVRESVPDDLERVNEIYDHYVRTSHATFDVEPVDPARRRSWFDDRRNERHRVVVAEHPGGIAGYASSGPHRPKPAYATTVETSVYVEPAWLGRGVGSALYALLFELLDASDVHRAVAGIAQPNPASVALHERFGFRRVGTFSEQGRKFGRFWDVDWYERPSRALDLGAFSADLRR
jgi:phosphinothricin acetyltransferase